MNRLVPEIVQSVPRRSAVVRSPAGLEPASDSVRANAAMLAPEASSGR